MGTGQSVATSGPRGRDLPAPSLCVRFFDRLVEIGGTFCCALVGSGDRGPGRAKVETPSARGLANERATRARERRSSLDAPTPARPGGPRTPRTERATGPSGARRPLADAKRYNALYRGTAHSHDSHHFMHMPTLHCDHALFGRLPSHSVAHHRVPISRLHISSEGSCSYTCSAWPSAPAAALR